MSEDCELFGEIPASDAAALANAKGWSVAECEREFAVNGRIHECAQCGGKFTRRQSRDNACGMACRRDLTHARMAAQQERSLCHQRRAYGYQARLQTKIF